MLRCACEKIVGQLRSSDVLGCYWGEEFMVILPETGLPQAEGIAERLRQCLAEMAVAVDGQTDIHFTPQLHKKDGKRVEKPSLHPTD